VLGAAAVSVGSLGRAMQQSIDGDTKSFQLDYIDWKHPENNVYHVAEEFAVERSGSHETRRPDVVLFVNGIPLAVIEERGEIRHRGHASEVLGGVERANGYRRGSGEGHLAAVE
jgi:type I site-specific restriction-modification system R (restriction) subunit